MSQGIAAYTQAQVQPLLHVLIMFPCHMGYLGMRDTKPYAERYHVYHT